MSALENVAGRVAVVTGGASGIGRGIAAQLIGAGATVVIADIEADPLAKTAGELGASGIVCDVTDPGSVAGLAERTMDLFGRVDIIVNNAGVGPRALVDDLTLADWRWIIEVNLFGVIHGVDTFLPLLEANPDGGHIVNTASMSVLLPPKGFASYVASKAGVLGLSEVLAQELEAVGSRVGVTVLCPGPVRTNIRNSLRSRPDQFAGGAGLKDHDIATTMPSEWRWADPADVGAIVVRAIQAGDLYAFTHPEWIDQIIDRNRELEGQFVKYPVLAQDEAPAR